jgi:carboxyl-terminal processing protease
MRNWSIALAILSLMCIGGLTALWLLTERGYAAAVATGDSRDHAMYDEVTNLLELNYDGEVDRENVLKESLRGAGRGVNDQYTAVFPPTANKRHEEQTTGEFGGVGVIVKPRPDGTLEVAEVRPGYGAAKAGVLVGDIIIAADGVPLKGLPYEKALDLIHGKAGTDVKLTVERDGKPVDMGIERKIIEMLDVQGARILPETDSTAYLRIERFTLKTAEQFRTAVTALKSQGMKRMILDLRRNGGGVLEAAVQIADEFIAEKGRLVVSLRTGGNGALEKRREEAGLPPSEYSAGETMYTNDDTALVSVPTVVLQDGHTASASEVLAGCLQDYGLVFIIGDRSYGKGLVQSTFRLRTDERYSVKITVASYYSPLGNHLFRTEDRPGGIEPDVWQPLTASQEVAMFRRFNVQAQKVPGSADEIKDAADRAAWVATDPNVEAALAYFRGEPVVVRGE